MINITSSKNEWTPKKLNELGFVGRGKSKHRPRNASFLYGGKYPFVQTGEIKSANLYISNYSQTYNDNGLAQSKLWEPGTLCITIAANIAETAILKIPACFPDSIVGFIADPQKSDVKFIKYSFDHMKRGMQNISRGTTQDNFSLDKLLSFDFLVPPLPTQHKIAAILSVYDDLIENNLRRIKILEEMAQNLYREWFVNFRFPDHEKVKMVDSPLGKIPEGWIVTLLGENTKLYRGRSYRSVDLGDSGGLPFLNLKCIERRGGFRYDGVKRYIGEYKENQLAKQGDVIVAVTDMTQERNIVAHVARVPKMDNGFAVISMDLIRIEPNKGIDKEYLYGMLQYSNFSDEVKQYANGVNVLHLNPDRIADFRFILAAKDIREKYSNLCSSVYILCDDLNSKNTIFRQTRDLLLPKLISGELDVSDLDVKVGEAA